MNNGFLDIGCGNKCKDGYIGLDKVQLPGVSIVADIEQGLPLKSTSCKVIRAHHVFEHVANLVGLMNEIHRVLMPNGRLEIGVPLVGCCDDKGNWVFGAGAYLDITHVRYFSEDSFNYWTILPNGRQYVGNTDVAIKGNFRIVDRVISTCYIDMSRYSGVNMDMVMEKM